MSGKEIKIQNINEAYDVYATLIKNDLTCDSNQKLLSILSVQIDAFSLATILNFFNKYPEFSRNHWQANLLIIRMFAIYVSELVIFLDANRYFDKSSIEQSHSFEDIKLLRNRIHQFRNREYKRKIKYIDQEMGRSRDTHAPHLDICLQYTNHKLLMGTNVYWFNFPEAKEQITIDLMQQIIRCVEKTSNYPNASFEIHRAKQTVEYKYEPYCYVDIVKSCKLKNKNLVDRLLLAFDDMCSIYDFFVYVVDVSGYLKQAPYITFYFTKMLAIILDETIDNLNNILKYSKNDLDKIIIEDLLSICPSNIEELCKKLRNNLHYERQDSVSFDDELKLFNNLFTISQELVKRIRNILNINPSKIKLNYYRLLKWLQE